MPPNRTSRHNLDMAGRRIRPPRDPQLAPSPQALDWHELDVFNIGDDESVGRAIGLSVQLMHLADAYQGFGRIARQSGGNCEWTSVRVSALQARAIVSSPTVVVVPRLARCSQSGSAFAGTLMGPHRRDSINPRIAQLHPAALGRTLPLFSGRTPSPVPAPTRC